MREESFTCINGLSENASINLDFDIELTRHIIDNWFKSKVCDHDKVSL